MPLVTIIVATDANGGIGKNGQLPWPRIAQDMKHFQNRTMGDVVIMGHATYRSIGRPLKGRTVIVLSRTTTQLDPGVIVAPSFGEAFARPEAHNRPIWIAGGEEVYRLGLPYAHVIERTVVHKAYDCDRFFPLVMLGEWDRTGRGLATETGTDLIWHETYVRNRPPMFTA